MLNKIKIIDYASGNNTAKRNLFTSLGFSVFLFLLTFLLYLNFSYMGARNQEIENIVFSNFKMSLFLINLKILLAYVGIGLILGVLSWLLGIVKKRYILLFSLFIWFMFWIRAIKLLPQMFTEQLYRKGGLLKGFQIAITDYIPLIAIYILFVVVIIAIGLIKKRLPSVLLVLGLAFLLILKVDVSPAIAGETQPSAPNVLIFATDSLRPDRISYNGYNRPTPTIDKLFSQGANCLNMKSSLARTLPSWTTIFTSTLPPEHGLRHMFPPKKGMKKNWVTMVDICNQNGYYTSVVSDFAGDIFPSIDYGFQDIVSPDLNIMQILKQRSQEIHYFLLGFLINPPGRLLFPEMWGMTLNKDPWYVTRYAKKSINKAIKQKKPFFLLAFSSNNHFPYVTKYPYYQLYTPKHYSGKHKYGLSSDVMESFLETGVSKEDIPQVANLYDNATKMFDDNLAEILNFVKQCKIDRNTIVVIMSDHGESLYEENYGLAHGDHLLGPFSNNMTFGIFSPFENLQGRQIKKTTRDIDIAPTILDILKLKIPSSFRGHSLLPVMKGADFPGYPAYMETGVWYSTTTPFIKNKVRLNYPDIVQLVDLAMPEGKIVLKPKYQQRVIDAKFRAYQLNERKYIYMPGEGTYKEEYYVDEKRVDVKDITDPTFLSFKEKMIGMFPHLFYIDQQGFIRERSKIQQ